MHWLLIVIIVLALIAASTINFRLGIGLLVALVLLAIVAYFVSGGGWRPGSDVADVIASKTTGTPAYAGSWQISTELANNSTSASVRDLTLEIAALSCPGPQSEESDCATIDTIEHRVGVTIPPGTTRNVSFTVAPREFNDIDNSRWRVKAVEVRTH